MTSNILVPGSTAQNKTSKRERHWLGKLAIRCQVYEKQPYPELSKSDCCLQQLNLFYCMDVSPGH